MFVAALFQAGLFSAFAFEVLPDPSLLLLQMGFDPIRFLCLESEHSSSFGQEDCGLTGQMTVKGSHPSVSQR